MTTTLLIQNGTLVTLGEPSRVLPGYSLLCRGDRIERIDRAETFSGTYDNVVDARGKVVMPGFINAHMHFYSTLVRGLTKAEPAKDFSQVLENLWWRFDKKLNLDDVEVSALVPLIEAVRHGTTTLIDHHASPFALRGSLERIARAVKKVGLRASLCYELSDRDGPAAARAGIDENVAFIKQVRAEDDPRVTAMFGLHASFTLSDVTLARATQAGAELGVGFHVHVAEAASDQDHAARHFGRRVVERLRAQGILGPKSIAAHCVHVTPREMDLLAETGTPVVHNPQSNMNNAVGVADVLELGRRGVLVGLGTDAMTVNMREEVRAALWIRRHAARDPSAGFTESLSTLLVNNARIANRAFAPQVGVLAEGYAADVVLLDYAPPTPLDDGTFLGHFAFGLTQAPVDTTIASGRVLMTHKQLALDVDEAEIAARARSLAAALWDRF